MLVIKRFLNGHLCSNLCSLHLIRIWIIWLTHNYPCINECIIIHIPNCSGKKERWKKMGGKDWWLIVLWLINKAIDQSVCSQRGIYMGSWMVGNNLSSHGVNPSKRGGCGLIVRWVRELGGFLHHAEMINAAVRLRHKHNSCSKCLNGYEWFCLILCVCTICVQLWICYTEMVQRRGDTGRVGVFPQTQESNKTSDYLKNPQTNDLFWLHRRL